MPFLIYCNSPLSLPVIYQNARFKILKPRCACTGVVLWLNDPPRYEHKSGAQASQYAYQSKQRNCGFYASQLPY